MPPARVDTPPAAGHALFQNLNVKLKLLLTFLLAALEPAAEDFEEGGAAAHRGEAGEEEAVGDLAHAGSGSELQAVAGG